MEKIYKEYAELTSQIKVLYDQQKELKEQIKEDLNTKEANQLKADFGTFSLVERKTWKYTEVIKDKAKDLAQAKKLEEESGLAKATVSKSIMFRGK
ncbi:MAG: hypothetical protein GY870_06855 [archaeon]|nr:hypothetical protein [archaeon]